ncbi:peptide ABC transporter permease [Rhodanobacter sp. B04]|uniref:ABC transporter permease n=1 Tax=Rhodanobacter sp. B04 TaxID=1945860 RepID=UPI000987CECC|nr:ABC transporter permease [Rhodanobacter sp. B04]OOG66441.1 peptide ABC transporter permease [Rhodanobacter sp. B04]
MFAYYLELAFRSLKRSPGLTALMVLAVGFGVSACMTTWSVFRAASGDPIPWKSSQLFVPQMDIWSSSARSGDGEPPDALTYTDALALMRDHRALRQSAIYEIAPAVFPARAGQHPLTLGGYAVYAEFFPMLDLPFLYGQGWSAAEDAAAAPVVVISRALNDKAFGGANSVGRSLDIAGHDYRVVGVIDDWNPQPAYYDVFGTGGYTREGPALFVPFTRAIAGDLENGRTACDAEPSSPGFAGLQRSECVWITFLAELDTPARVRAYRQYLDDYAAMQRRAGRFLGAPNNRLRDLPAFLAAEQVVPGDTRVSFLVAVGLLVVCLFNTVGLLLAKFLRRSGEIGVRRALGAGRGAIYAQFLTEAAIVGLAGGALGLLLTGLGVLGIGAVLQPRLAALATLDVRLLVTTVVVAVLCTVLAGLYPSFRAARVQPAWQLKSD